MATKNPLIHDGDQVPVQIGNSIQTSDGAASPITSPLTLTGSVQTITVPLGAVEFIVYPLAHALNVSELANMATYDVVALGSKESIPCARMALIYVQGTLSDTLYFRFTIV